MKREKRTEEVTRKFKKNYGKLDKQVDQLREKREKKAETKSKKQETWKNKKERKVIVIKDPFAVIKQGQKALAIKRKEEEATASN